MIIIYIYMYRHWMLILSEIKKSVRFERERVFGRENERLRSREIRREEKMTDRRRPEVMVSLADCSGVMEATASGDGRPWRLQRRAKSVQQVRKLVRDSIDGSSRRACGGR